MTENIYKGGHQVNQNGVLEYTYPFFEVYWNNAYWRATLFPGRVFPAGESLAKNDFIILVNNISDLDNPLYKFINVK
jgi:hypothetical protein